MSGMSAYSTRYQPVDDGYQIIGSGERFNRTLYGSHANDDLTERYFTFAGDVPLFMGAVTDWTQNSWGNYAKNGVLMSGVALTPGMQTPSFYSDEVDVTSHWFHNSEDTVAVFRNGWMEYELCQLSPWFPNVKINISIFPLIPEDGFLVHYKIKTDQQIIFCAGFGGITDFISRLEYPPVKARHFRAVDCKNNVVTCAENRALLTGPNETSMWIGANFPVNMEIGDGELLQDYAPAKFLEHKNNPIKLPVVKLFSSINPGGTLDGFLVVIRNVNEKTLEKWLNDKDAINNLKQQIHAKKSAVSMHTPDRMLNLTVPPTILAMDASWHKNTFYHGAHAYHAPFLGWRNWYGPTVIGWHDRVEKAVESHFSQIVKNVDGEEAVWYDGKDRPDLDHEGTQYHQIRNSYGFIPAMLGKNDIYNMQEVAVNMFFYHLDWTGDFSIAQKLLEDIRGILDWEERILDPDHDGLYQNFLNTWISDGHSYNGGGCAQASAYNYSANLMMEKLAQKVGFDGKVFAARAEKIKKSVIDNLWLASKGVLAEFIDTIGNKLVHPSPELSTIYLAIECGVVDMFQAYQMLKFTETDICNEKTLNRKGRLVYSSNWYPKKYSTCGIFTAENLNLALSYFQMGLASKGHEILNAIVDGYFTGKNPGLVSHVLTAHGVSDGGDLDFSDVSSMYLRLIVEGLFGIRFHLLDNTIEISPNFPAAWMHANIKLRDISLNYFSNGCQENLKLYCENAANKKIKIPMRSSQIIAVQLNDEPINYKIEAAVNNCYLVVETKTTGFIHLQIVHGNDAIPSINYQSQTFGDNQIVIDAINGEIIEYKDTSKMIDAISVLPQKLYGKINADSGNHTIFVRVKNYQYDAWMAADFIIEPKAVTRKTISSDKKLTEKFRPLDISPYFNCSLLDIHMLKYMAPRPKGYSIGMRLNGRYAWDWNQGGHNAVCVDDTALRQAGGVFCAPSGIAFATPANGLNVACASLWENFPTIIRIPLLGKADELALFFIGVTNPMQSRIENARITVTYADGSQQKTSLVNPENFDDWLNAAIQTQSETVYFSDYNHGIVQRISLDDTKDLLEISIEAIANEVIFGLLGISVRK